MAFQTLVTAVMQEDLNFCSSFCAKFTSEQRYFPNNLRILKNVCWPWLSFSWRNSLWEIYFKQKSRHCVLVVIQVEQDINFFLLWICPADNHGAGNFDRVIFWTFSTKYEKFIELLSTDYVLNDSALWSQSVDQLARNAGIIMNGE